MSTELIKVDAEKSGVTQKLADQIEDTFSGMVATLREFDAEYDSIIDDADLDIDAKLAKRANKLRNKIVKVRTGADKARKTAKSQYQSAVKAIDGTFNIFKHAVEGQETKLMDIEKHEERREAARIEERLEWRVDKLKHFIDFSDIDMKSVREMEGDVWIMYLQGAESDYERRIEAEEKAEEERKAKAEQEAKDREAERVEKVRLKKVADEAELELEELRKQKAADQKVTDDHIAAMKKIDDEKQKKLDEFEADKKKHDDKIAADKKVKADAARALLNAGDEEKLQSLQKQIEMLSIPELNDKLLMGLIKEKARELYVAAGGE